MHYKRSSNTNAANKWTFLSIVIGAFVVISLLNIVQEIFVEYMHTNPVIFGFITCLIITAVLVYCIIDTQQSKNKIIDIKLFIESDNGDNVMSIVADAINDIWKGTYSMRTIGDDVSKVYLFTNFTNTEQNKIIFNQIMQAIKDTGLNVIFDHEDKKENMVFLTNEINKK